MMVLFYQLIWQKLMIEYNEYNTIERVREGVFLIVEVKNNKKKKSHNV
jgi:hypothetical protein